MVEQLEQRLTISSSHYLDKNPALEFSADLLRSLFQQTEVSRSLRGFNSSILLTQADEVRARVQDHEGYAHNGQPLSSTPSVREGLLRLVGAGGQELLVVKSKSRMDRVVPVSGYALHFTEAYLKAVRPCLAKSDEEKSLFVSVRGGPLAVRTVGQIVGRAAKTSGVTKTITPHTFRHSMATHSM